MPPRRWKASCARTQVTQNLFPCCFLPVMAVLAPGESAAVYSLYGQAENKRQVAALSQCAAAPGWFAKKRQEAADLTDELCAPITAQTADPIFDAYAKQSWLDNFLRGGVPTCFPGRGKADALLPLLPEARRPGAGIQLFLSRERILRSGQRQFPGRQPEPPQ